MKIKKSLIILSTIGILGSSSILPLASCGQVTPEPDPVIEYYEVKESDVTLRKHTELTDATVITDIRSDLTEKNLLFSRDNFSDGIYQFEWANVDNVKNRFDSFKFLPGFGAKTNSAIKKYNHQISQKVFPVLGLKEIYFSSPAPLNVSDAKGIYDFESSMTWNPVAALENISQRITFDFDIASITVSGGGSLPFYSTSILPKQIFVRNTYTFDYWAATLGINFSQHQDVFHFLP